MDRFQQSFIPKKISFPAQSKAHAGPVFNIFAISASAVFAISLGFAVYVFIYQNILAKNIEQMSQELALKKSALEINFMREALSLDKRLKSVTELLSKHTAPAEIFTLLEEKTLTTVRFNDFSFSYMPTGEARVAAKGEAKNFASVALQSDAFGAEPNFINPVFSDFNLKDDGNVEFRVNVSIKPDFISYAKSKGVLVPIPGAVSPEFEDVEMFGGPGVVDF